MLLSINKLRTRCPINNKYRLLLRASIIKARYSNYTIMMMMNNSDRKTGVGVAESDSGAASPARCTQESGHSLGNQRGLGFLAFPQPQPALVWRPLGFRTGRTAGLAPSLGP